METLSVKKAAVTGAFGFTGKYTARILIEKNIEVITLTNSLQRENPFENKIKAYAFNFDNPERLTETLLGTDVLVNTYWVRFNHKTFRHDEAVRNTKILFSAAEKAGVKKIIHVSITNPSTESDLEYFKGKAELENVLKNTKILHTILRPAVIFGKEDILINNIAWVVRKLPLFGVYGKGDYKIQPIFVEDIAQLIVKEIFTNKNKIINAIGPETFTYKDLVETIARIIGVKRKIIEVSPGFGYFAGKIISLFKGDFTITKPEIKGLCDNLLYVDAPPAGQTKLSDWLKENRATVGTRYANELARRLDRTLKY